MRPKTQRPAAATAFTLIELLTVIAIIGILAAILIPVVGRVRESARSSACVSNVRQISTAFSLYAADNGGLIPAAMGSNNGGENPTGGFWMVELNPYVGHVQEPGGVPNLTVSEFFSCPTYFGEDPTLPVWRRGYGMTTRPDRALQAGTAPATAQTQRTLLERWPEHSRSIIVGESPNQMVNSSNTGIISEEGGNNAQGHPRRHSGRANYGFFDGSVRSMDPDQAAAFMRWVP
jgi:prepilin-type processing-associated H-X9-DG protein/prepilin-type N-terminal cleavage/methylation domain-containing protein